MSKIKIGIAGCLGRMGQEIVKQVLKDNRFIFVGGFENKNHPKVNKKISEVVNIKSDLIISGKADDIISKAHVIVDFTSPLATISNIQKASLSKTGYVVGTTGMTKKQLSTIRSYSKNIPILMSSNMSLGVNLLFNIVQQTASVLKSSEYDIEINETHHKYKVDAPSGTALSLGEYAAVGRNTNINKTKVMDRTKKNTKRNEGDIGFSVIRGGEIAGEHTVSFISANDRIDLIHKANNRSIFVSGAIDAAFFISNKKKGFFDMKDLLFKK